MSGAPCGMSENLLDFYCYLEKMPRHQIHGVITKKIVYLAALSIFGFLFSSPVSASTEPPPEVFQGYDPVSSMTIDYKDLDSLLQTVVLDTGPSTRELASIPKNSTGTRMRAKVNRATINEGNRFYFETFNENKDNQQIIQNIKSRLENFPAAVPLERFSRDEQLAYWINLYNITILNEIVNIYPRNNLKGLRIGRINHVSARSGKYVSPNRVEISTP
jgi:hypothetical protein